MAFDARPCQGRLASPNLRRVLPDAIESVAFSDKSVKNCLCEQNLEDRGGYLYALVSGKTLTPAIAKLYWDEIAERCSALGKSKIMIEKEFEKSVSPPEMLEMGVYLGKILAGEKIAFLDKYKNENINELGKVIARNQGVIMRIFNNTEDAQKWLSGD